MENKPKTELKEARLYIGHGEYIEGRVSFVYLLFGHCILMHS